MAKVRAQSGPTGSIVINGGDAFTNSTSVTLTLTVGDLSNILSFGYSNYDDAGTVQWDIFFSPTKPWTLLSGNGVKTVYYFLINSTYDTSKFSDTIVLDTALPTGSIVINGGATFASSASVTLTLTANDAGSGVSQVRYSNNGAWGSDTEGWESFSSTKSWSLSSGDGGKTVYYQIKDKVGSVSILYSDSIVLDTAAPTGSIVINGGDAFTTSTSVTLTLTANDQTSGVYRVRYSNDGVWDTEPWEAFSSTKPWTLSTGDGAKTVYYQIRDNAGSDSTFSDTIVLDTVLPTGSIVINGGDAFTSSSSVSLALTASDSTSGVFQVRYSNDGVWDIEPWQAFSETKSWTLSSGNGVKTVYYQVRDNAGLNSSTYSDTITLSTLAPTGSIVINDDDEFATSESVTLSLTYEDDFSGVDKVRYSNDGAWNSETWETAAETKTWTLTSGDGAKTVYYQIRNKLGLTSITYSDTIVLDTAEPIGFIVINNGDASTSSYSATLTLMASDATSGVFQVRYSNNGVWNSDAEGWEAFSAVKAWTLSSGDGAKTVYYQIKDNAGMVSATYSDTILLESPSPTPPSPTPSTSTPTPSASTPTPGATSSPQPTWSETLVIPPEAFYATAAIGIVSMVAIFFLAFRRPKSSKNTDDLTES